MTPTEHVKRCDGRGQAADQQQAWDHDDQEDLQSLGPTCRYLSAVVRWRQQSPGVTPTDAMEGIILHPGSATHGICDSPVWVGVSRQFGTKTIIRFKVQSMTQSMSPV